MKDNHNHEHNQVFDDRLILIDVLTALKHVGTTYGTATTEGSTQDLRDLLSTYSGKASANQFATFQLMNERGIYPLTPATKAEMKKLHDTHKGCVYSCK